MSEQDNSKNRGEIKMFGNATYKDLEQLDEKIVGLMVEWQKTQEDEIKNIKNDLRTTEKNFQTLQLQKNDTGDLSPVMNRLSDLESKMGHLWDLLTHKNLKNETALSPAGNRFARRFGNRN